MFGHPTRSAFALVSRNSRFLNGHTYNCKVTQYEPFSKVFKDMGVAMEVACFSRREIDECPQPILGNVRMTPSAVESLLVGRLQEHEKKRIGGQPFPHPFSKDWFQTLNLPSSDSQMLVPP